MARPFDDEPFQLAFVGSAPERQNAPAVTARAARRGLRAIVLSPQQLRQLGDIGGDAPGLVAGQEVRRRASGPGSSSK